jgi:phosphomannomutase
LHPKGATVQFSSSLFKAYDIRGVVPSTLDATMARALGRAFGDLAMGQDERAVVVGRDGRLSGPTLVAALIEGLRDAGVDVIDVGMVTTPMLYFAATSLAQSGIQVTASHNPRDHNGFKLVLGGRTLFGEALQDLRRRMEAGFGARAAQRGALLHANVEKAYRDCIASDVRLARPMKIALDCGNGAAGAFAPAVFRAIGCEVEELFCDVDGGFPHHEPDPTRPENLAELVRAVREGDSELGLALAGDASAVRMVTKSGDVLAVPPTVATADHPCFGDRWEGLEDGIHAACRWLEAAARWDDGLRTGIEGDSMAELRMPTEDGEPRHASARLAQRAV